MSATAPRRESRNQLCRNGSVYFIRYLEKSEIAYSYGVTSYCSVQRARGTGYQACPRRVADTYSGLRWPLTKPCDFAIPRFAPGATDVFNQIIPLDQAKTYSKLAMPFPRGFR